MILAIDVGNTNTVLGAFEGRGLLWKLRLRSLERTCDEWWLLLRDVMGDGVEGGIISSVVPSISGPLREFFEEKLKRRVIFVAPGIKTGLSILYNPPSAVGADRIANAVAGREEYGAPLIIVDFGTAITFDVISRKGEYLGGLIFPGIRTSSLALYAKAAKLPQVEFVAREGAVGRNTAESMEKGLFIGFKSMVDGTIRAIKEEIGGARVVGTGGEGREISRASEEIELYDEDLTLKGLRIIYELNR